MKTNLKQLMAVLIIAVLLVSGVSVLAESADGSSNATPVPQPQQEGTGSVSSDMTREPPFQIIFVKDYETGNSSPIPIESYGLFKDDVGPKPPVPDPEKGYIWIGPFEYNGDSSINYSKPYVPGKSLEDYLGRPIGDRNSGSINFAFARRTAVPCTVRGISRESSAILYETPIELPENWETTVSVSDYEKADAVKGFTCVSNSRKVTATTEGQIITFEYYTNVYAKAPDTTVSYQLNDNTVAETAQVFRVNDDALFSGVSFPDADLSCTAQIPGGSAVGTSVPLTIVSDGLQGKVDNSGKYKITDVQNGSVTVSTINDLVVDVAIDPLHTVYNNTEQSPAAPVITFTAQNHPDEFAAFQDQFRLTEQGLAKLAAIKQTDAGTYSMGLTAEDFTCASPIFTGVTFNVPDGGQFIIDQRQLTVTLAQQNWLFKDRAQLQNGLLAELTNNAPSVWATLSSANGEGTPLCDGHALAFRVKTKSLPMAGLNEGCLIFDKSSESSFQIKGSDAIKSDAIKNYDISESAPADIDISASDEQRISMILDTVNPDTIYKLNDTFTYTVKLTNNTVAPVTLNFDFFTQPNAQMNQDGSKTTQTVTLLSGETQTLTEKDTITAADLFYNTPDAQGQLPGARRAFVMKEEEHSDRTATVSVKTAEGASSLDIACQSPVSGELKAGESASYTIQVSCTDNLGYVYNQVEVTADNGILQAGSGYTLSTTADGRSCAIIAEMKNGDTVSVAASSASITTDDILYGRKNLGGTVQAAYTDALGADRKAEKTVSLCLPCEPAKFDLSATLELNPDENYDHRSVNVLENCDFILKLKNNGNVPLDGLTAKASYPGTYFAPKSPVNDTGALSIPLLNPGKSYLNHLYVHVEEEDILNFKEPAVFAVVDNEATINGSVSYWKLKAGGDPHNDSDYEKAVWPSKEIKTEKPKINLAPPESKIALKLESAEPEKTEGYSAGDVIKYKIRCKNEGNLSVKNIKVTSSTPGVEITNVYIDDSTLAPQIGENGQNGKAVGNAFERKEPLGPKKIVYFQAEYTVTAEDIINGKAIFPRFTGKAEKCYETQPKVNDFGVDNWYDMKKFPVPLIKNFVFSKVLWDSDKHCEMSADHVFRRGETIYFRTTFQNTGNVPYSVVNIAEEERTGLSIAAVEGGEYVTIDGKNITITNLPPQGTVVLQTEIPVGDALLTGGEFDESTGSFKQRDILFKVTLTDILYKNGDYEKKLLDEPHSCSPTVSLAECKASLIVDPLQVSLRKKDASDFVPFTGNEAVKIGDQLKFSFSMQNTGDISLANIQIQPETPIRNCSKISYKLPDGMPEPESSGGAPLKFNGNLHPGKTIQIEFFYDVSGTDVAKHFVYTAATDLIRFSSISIFNTEYSIGNSPISLGFDIIAEDIQPNPVFTLSKTEVQRGGNPVPAESGLCAGDQITFEILMTNKCNAPLPYIAPVITVDPASGLTIQYECSRLEHNQSAQIKLSCTVTNEDVLASLTEGKEFIEKHLSYSVACESEAGPSHNKEANGTFTFSSENLKIQKPAGDVRITAITPGEGAPFKNGDTVFYDVTVKNFDSIFMRADVTSAIADTSDPGRAPILAASADGSYSSAGNHAVTRILAPGEEVKIRYSCTVMEKDLLNGGLPVTASAQISTEDPNYASIPGKVHQSEPLTLPTQEIRMELSVFPHNVNFEGTQQCPNFGDTVEFTITVFNGGNVTLRNLNIREWNDSRFVGADILPSDDGSYTVSNDGKTAIISELPPIFPNNSEKITINASYTVQREDIRNGKIEFAVTADAANPHTPDSREDIGITGNVSASIRTCTPTIIFDSSSSSLMKDLTGVPEGRLLNLNETAWFNGTIKLDESSNVLPDQLQLKASEGTVFDSSNAPGTLSENNTVLTIAPVDISAVYKYRVFNKVDYLDIALGEVRAAVTAEGYFANSASPLPDSYSYPSIGFQTAEPRADLSLTMTASIPEGKSLAGIGDEIVYTITAGNNGNLLFKNLVITNELAGLTLKDVVPSEAEISFTKNPDGSVTVAQIKPGQFVTVTASYTVTEQDILKKGWIINTATAKAYNSLINVPEVSASAKTEADDIDPKVNIVLSCEAEKPGVGDVITICADLTHSGSISNPYAHLPVEFTPETVSIQSGVSGTSGRPCFGSLTAPVEKAGGAVRIEGKYTVTEQDIINGKIDFTLKVADRPENSQSTAFPNSKAPGTFICPYGSGVLSVPTQDYKKPLGITIAQHNMPADVSMNFALGETIQYDVRVWNMGNVTCKNVTFDIPDGFQLCDENWNPVEGKNVTIPELKAASNDTMHYYMTHKVNQEDLLNGMVGLWINAEADPLINSITNEKKTVENVSGTSTYTEKIVPQLTVLQNADAPIGKALCVGDKIGFIITIKNEGNIDIKDIEIQNLLEGYKFLPGEGITIEDGIVKKPLLPAGKEISFNAEHTVQEADIIGGGIFSTVTAKGVCPPVKSTYPHLPPENPEAKCPWSTLSVVKLQSDLAVSITADKEGTKVDLGDVISYTITVKNAGNVTYTNVVTQLDPDVAQQDKQNGKILPSENGKYTLDQDGKARISKMSPGEEVILNGQYTVTENDLGRGSIKAAAAAQADFLIFVQPHGSAETAPIVCAEPAPQFTLTLDTPDQADPAHPYALNNTVRFRITFKNEGNVTLHNIEIEELPNIDFENNPSGHVLRPDPLPPKKSLELYVNYRITVPDIISGEFKNTVTAKCTAALGNTDIPAQTAKKAVKTEDIKTNLDVSAQVTKPSSLLGAGDRITYVISVTNKGNVNYTNVAVQDSRYTLDITGITPSSANVQQHKDKVVISQLNVNETVNIHAAYTVTVQDILAGGVYNVFTAKGSDIADSHHAGAFLPVESQKNVSLETEDIKATLELTKTSDIPEGAVVKPGDTIRYTITLKNAGNTHAAYTNVVVHDNLPGIWINAGKGYKVPAKGTVTISSLPYGKPVSISASYKVTDQDILNGKIINQVSASADGFHNPKNPGGSEIIPENNAVNEVMTEPLTASVTVQNTSNVPADKLLVVGNQIKYTVTVKNNSNVSLHHVVVKDHLEGTVPVRGNGYTVKADGTIEIEELKAGKTISVAFRHTVDEKDIAAGKIENRVTVSADTLHGHNQVMTPAGESSATNAVQTIYSYRIESYTQNEDGSWKHEKQEDMEKTAAYGSKAEYQDQYHPGFAFDPSLTENGSAVVPANNNLVVKLFYVSVPRTYHAEHYLQELDGSWPAAPVQTDEFTGRVDDKAVYTLLETEGFRYDKSLTVNKDAIIPDNDDLVIRLYYTRRNDFSYTVEYRLAHENGRKIHPSKNVDNVVFGQIITETPAEVFGYTCEEESHDIEITVSSVQNKYVFIYQKVYHYTIEYYYDNVKDEHATEHITLPEYKTILSYPGRNKAGYKMDHAEPLPLMLVHNGEDNIIRVYYKKVTPAAMPAVPPQSIGIMHTNVIDCFE